MSRIAILGLLVGLTAGCSRPGAVERAEWPVMGTVAAVQWRSGGEQAPNLAREMAAESFREVENLLNAHNPDSELSRLAVLPEAEILAKCDVRMRPCYAAAFELAKASGGAFNPRWKGAQTLDLGAIAKGFAVDLAYGAILRGAGASCPRLLIDLGGNLRAVGDEWTVGVLGADGTDFCRKVVLRPSEAVATSATYYRGSHIRDGRTNRPVSNDVASVTVVATTAMVADGLSTTLFVLGPQDGLGHVKSYGRDVVAVLWVMKDGRQVEYDPGGRLGRIR